MARSSALSILDILQSSGLSQAQLAELLGVSRESVSKYARGERRPSVEVIERLQYLIPSQIILQGGSVRIKPHAGASWVKKLLNHTK
jgi:predicted transcriptional regulator